VIDLARIVGFDWDEGNACKSSAKHGASQAEAEQVFVNVPLSMLDDLAHSRSEQRFQALGKTLGGRHLHVTFTLRAEGTKIRAVSARDMNRKERARYEEKA
jgi:uncharacterized DUF497 family protein